MNFSDFKSTLACFFIAVNSEEILYLVILKDAEKNMIFANIAR